MFNNILNAVKGIASSITSAVKGFTSPKSSTQASRPQLTQQQVSGAYRSAGTTPLPNYNQIAQQSSPVARAFQSIQNVPSRGAAGSIQKMPTVPSAPAFITPRRTPPIPPIRSVANALQNLSSRSSAARKSITDFGRDVARTFGQSVSTKDAISYGTTALSIILGGREGQFSQGFGARPLLYQRRAGLAGHEGADYEVPKDTPLFSPMEEGEVVDVGYDPQGYGKFVGIRNSKTNEYVLLGHMDRVDVQQGDTIKAGQQVGLSGDTGFSEAPHVHISYTKDYSTRLSRSGGFGGFENPLAFLTGKTSPVDFLASNLPESAKEIINKGYSDFTTSLGKKLAMTMEQQGASPDVIASIMERMTSPGAPTQSPDRVTGALQRLQLIPTAQTTTPEIAPSRVLTTTDMTQPAEADNTALTAIMARAGSPPAPPQAPATQAPSSFVPPPPPPATPQVALEATPVGATRRAIVNRPRTRTGGYV